MLGHDARRRLESQRAVIGPAGPAMARLEHDAGGIEPPEPGTQQRRCFQAFRKHPPARSDECLLPQPFTPRAQLCGRKRLDRTAQMRRRGAVASKKRIKRLRMGEIEPAAPGEQEFASRRRHAVEHRDVGAALRHHLGGHQPGRSRPNDRDVRVGFHRDAYTDARTESRHRCTRALSVPLPPRAKRVVGRGQGWGAKRTQFKHPPPPTPPRR